METSLISRIRTFPSTSDRCMCPQTSGGLAAPLAVDRRCTAAGQDHAVSELEHGPSREILRILPLAGDDMNRSIVIPIQEHDRPPGVYPLLQLVRPDPEVAHLDDRGIRRNSLQ